MMDYFQVRGTNSFTYVNFCIQQAVLYQKISIVFPLCVIIQSPTDLYVQSNYAIHSNSHLFGIWYAILFILLINCAQTVIYDSISPVVIMDRILPRAFYSGRTFSKNKRTLDERIIQAVEHHLVIAKQLLKPFTKVNNIYLRKIYYYKHFRLFIYETNVNNFTLESFLHFGRIVYALWCYIDCLRFWVF